MEFSCKYNLLIDKVFDCHVRNKMKMLESNRNYLQLNKISIKTFEKLLGRFIDSIIAEVSNTHNTKNNTTNNPPNTTT